MKKQLVVSVFVVFFMGLLPQKVTAQEGFLGEVKLFAGNFAPRNWAFCEGQTIAITSYTALFHIVGTTYGGDGVKTFALPDLRGRVPIGIGSGPGLSTIKQGEKLGRETVTLKNEHLPSHHHILKDVTETAIKLPAANNSNTESQKILAPVATPTGNEIITFDSGGSYPVSITPPSLGLHYIICITGVFPSRN